MKKFLILFAILLTCISISPAAFADTEDAQPVWIGSWMLDRVYEFASSENPLELQPENAASLYAESSNIYTFTPDGSAEMVMNDGGEKLFQRGTWENSSGTVRMIMEESEFEMELTPASDGKSLHRYWKESSADSTYHDLDFVYTKVPAGSWKMTQVISTEPGNEPKVLDPESAASLYSESSNVYYLFADGTASVSLPEGAEESGSWRCHANQVTLTLSDGFEMIFEYDTKTETLHRYWKDDTPDAMYKNLDFVYLPSRD